MSVPFFQASSEDYPLNVTSLNELSNVTMSTSEIPDELIRVKLLDIVAYSVLFALGAPANLRVLFILLQNKCYKRSRHHLILLHLAIADTLVCALMIPTEIWWRVTNAWKASELACKAFQFFRVFGPYSSSLVLICISLDRYYAVTDPFNYASHATDVKIKRLLWIIWVSAAVLSMPQLAIFTVQPHPEQSWFLQCIDFNFFQKEWHEKGYNISSLVTLYFGPLFVIAFCYARICWLSFGRTRPDRNGSAAAESSPAAPAEETVTIEMETASNWNHSSENTLVVRAPRGASQRQAQRHTAVRKSILKQTVTIVVTFVICWTPYVFITMWYQIDSESAKQLHPSLSGLLFIFAVSNSSLNPFIYGKFVKKQPNK